MFKKIILWTLLGGLIVLLTAGAINRTLAKSGDNYAQSSRGEPSRQNQVETSRDGGQGFGRGYETSNQNSQYDPGVAQSGELEWFTLEGQVVDLDPTALLVSIAGQEDLEIGGRAWIFAQEAGFTPQPGDDLLLTGFFETEDHFEVSRIQNQSSGEALTLRDEGGRPMWAGWRRGG
jgi:hypothetical protein